MSKYHVNLKTGEAGPCRATVKKCPLGGDSGNENHFSTEDEARAHYESTMGNSSTPEPLKASLSYLKREVSSDPKINTLGVKIREALSDRDWVIEEKLLKGEYLAGTRPMTGHCYTASEALYHLIGGKAAGWTPVGMKHEGSQHWWLRGPNGEIVDLTAEQFLEPVPYGQGKGRGFLTKDPSKRTQKILDRISQ